MNASEQEAAEALIRAQQPAEAHVVDACRAAAAKRWDRHYDLNPRNYHDRRYLHNEYPSLLEPAHGRDADDADSLLVLETGCGVGNALLPLLALSDRVRAFGCDHAPGAVERANERLVREGLAKRGRAFCWDIGKAPPRGHPLPSGGVDTVLAIFTLSALPPADLPAAWRHLAACLRPGGQLLLRDYGRLDLKQLKFARTAHGFLGSHFGGEWYARGDGTTCLFLTTDAVHALAEDAGLEVVDLRYDRRLVVNRASQRRMHRVWLVGTLRKPGASVSSRASRVRRWLAKRTGCWVAGVRSAFVWQSDANAGGRLVPGVAAVAAVAALAVAYLVRAAALHGHGSSPPWRRLALR